MRLRRDRRLLRHTLRPFHVRPSRWLPKLVCGGCPIGLKTAAVRSVTGPRDGVVRFADLNLSGSRMRRRRSRRRGVSDQGPPGAVSDIDAWRGKSARGESAAQGCASIRAPASPAKREQIPFLRIGAYSLPRGH